MVMVLMHAKGAFLEDVPEDVPVKSLNAVNSSTAWLPLARLLRRQPPEILFSTSGGTNLIAVLASRLAGFRNRVVLSERNLVRSSASLKRRLAASLKRLAYPRADLITAVSERVREDLTRELGLRPDDVAVLYNPVVSKGLGRAAAEPVDHPWFSEPTPTLLTVGRLVPQKDHVTLIDAFAQVRAQRQARLVILGEGPLRVRLERQARGLGVAADISLPGFDKNPFKYMARCSLFVLSSLWEGLPGVLIQAMACGAPAISTDCSGARSPRRGAPDGPAHRRRADPPRAPGDALRIRRRRGAFPRRPAGGDRAIRATGHGHAQRVDRSREGRAEALRALE